MHKHLSRLERVWIDAPVYFITTCTNRRTARLACATVAAVLVDEWKGAQSRHGWMIDRYVVMPDHVHFFCAAAHDDAKPLSAFMKNWKEWTSKRIKRQFHLTDALWQEEFFDHVLRSSEGYTQKWEYVRANPVRAGLVTEPDDWPWQGEIEEL